MPTSGSLITCLALPLEIPCGRVRFMCIPSTTISSETHTSLTILALHFLFCSAGGSSKSVSCKGGEMLIQRLVVPCDAHSSNLGGLMNPVAEFCNGKRIIPEADVV
ncbi:hypothetical protein Tco_1160065 [Tanacetum coccineum]